MTQIYLDSSGTSCPKCHQSSTLRFSEVPASRTVYTSGGKEHTTHNGPSRDYDCGNCGALWTMHEMGDEIGGDLLEQDRRGPVTPLELLQIATRITAMGDHADAARLRRLGDDLVSKPVTIFEVGCVGIAMTALRDVRSDLIYKDLPTAKIDEAIGTIDSLISKIKPKDGAEIRAPLTDCSIDAVVENGDA